MKTKAELKLEARLAAIPRFEAIAPNWKIALAKFFGRKAVTVNEGIKVTSYKWLGTEYVVDMADTTPGPVAKDNGLHSVTFKRVKLWWGEAIVPIEVKKYVHGW